MAGTHTSDPTCHFAANITEGPAVGTTGTDADGERANALDGLTDQAFDTAVVFDADPVQYPPGIRIVINTSGLDGLQHRRRDLLHVFRCSSVHVFRYGIVVTQCGTTGQITHCALKA